MNLGTNQIFFFFFSAAFHLDPYASFPLFGKTSFSLAVRSPLAQRVLPKETHSPTAEEGSTLPSFLNGNPGQPAQPCQGLPPLESLAGHRLMEEQDVLQELLWSR